LEAAKEDNVVVRDNSKQNFSFEKNDVEGIFGQTDEFTDGIMDGRMDRQRWNLK